LAGIAAGVLPVKLNLLLCALFFTPCTVLSAQHAVAIPTPLPILVAEAQANNSDVASADDNWKASTHAAQQVTARPGPRFTLDESSVGSPKPFAGFSNSEFGYLGFAASQDVPYKGKLKLRGEVANREAETQKASVGIVRSSVAEQVKLLYLQISYSTGAIAYLDRTDSVLQSLIQDALARYSLGQGSQAVILRAQLERTQIQRQDTMHNQTLGQAQARIKQLLHRRQDSPDIVPEPLAASPFARDTEELQSLLRNQNPRLQKDAAAIEKQGAQVASAKREGKPDFTFGYKFEVTGSGYRNRYVASASIQLPNRSRVAGEIAQAAEQENRARHELDSEVQQSLAELQAQFVAVKYTSELLNEFTQGLLPQAEAVFHSEESAYQANKQDLATVLTSLVDVLQLENDYQQALFDHEAALVRIETLTGEALR
jgi:outer membrane protein TolC